MAKTSGLRAAAAATPLNGETVEANGVDVFIGPLSVAQLFMLAGDFKSVENLVNRLIAGEELTEKDVLAALLKDGAEGAAAMIVMAAREGRNKDLREALLQFPDDDFFGLLSATVRRTAPNGIQELFDRAIRFLSVMQGRVTDAEQDAVPA